MQPHYSFTAIPRNPYVFGWAHPVALFRRFALRTGIPPLRNLSKFIMKIWCRFLRQPLTGSFGLNTPDGTISIQISSSNSAFETVLTWPRGSFEPVVRLFIDQLLPDDGVFYDIGANWGYFSLFACSRPGFSGKIFAFEPFPPTADDFTTVLAQTPFADRVTLIREALSDKEGTATMILPHRVKRAQASISESADGTRVGVRPLDNMGLPGPDVMKIDVEGHEANVLAGSRETLLRFRPAIVFENWVLADAIEKTRAPIEILERLGYEIFVPSYSTDSRTGEGKWLLEKTTAASRMEHERAVDIYALFPEHEARLRNKIGT